MESSFKKDVERSVKPNGDVELHYRGIRFSPAGLISFAIILMIVLLPISCAATYPLVDDHNPSKWSWTMFMLIFWAASLSIILFSVVKMKKVLTVKPDQGVIIDGRRLPFKDISDVGVDFVSHTEHAYFAYADSHGKKIKLTCWVTQSVANAIANAVTHEAKKAK